MGARPRRDRGGPGTRLGIDGAKHQGDVLARGGADRGEDGGPQLAELPAARRALGPRRHQRWQARPLLPTRAFAGKTVHRTVLQPGSLLEPQLDPLVAMALGGFGRPRAEPPSSRACLAPRHRAEGDGAAPVSREKPSRPKHLGHARGATGPAEAPLEPAAEIGARPGASRRPRQDRGRARHAAVGSASSCGASRRGGRPLGRSRSPARPSALWRTTASRTTASRTTASRTTASRSAWRPMPASRAASAGRVRQRGVVSGVVPGHRIRRLRV